MDKKHMFFSLPFFMFLCYYVTGANICFQEVSQLIKKYDNPFLIILAVLIAAMFLIQHFTGSRGSNIQIFQNGTIIATYSLYQNQTFTVSTEDGHSNTIEIKNGEVWVSDADCPDLLCVRQGHISKNGESIICLPHKLTILVKSDVSDDIDTISQ